jgi:hypothetical protein
MRATLLSVWAIVAVAAPAAAQVYTPIPVTGYTDDVIADASGTAMGTTTAAVDNGFEPYNNNVFIEQGYSTGGSATGIPANGTIITSATRAYQLGPITGNNSLRITQANPVGSLTFVTPARDAALSILLNAGDAITVGNVGFPDSVTINWSNGQSSAFPYTAYDWWDNGTPNPPPGMAIDGLNRVDRSTGLPISIDLSINPTPTFAIYYYDISLVGDANYQAGALVDSLEFQWPGSSTNAPDLALDIMGLSGATTVPEPSTLFLTVAAAGLWFFRRRSAFPEAERANGTQAGNRPGR